MARVNYAPYAPLNVLKRVGDGIWVVDGPEMSFGYLGLKMSLPTRMTVVRLPGGELWLHSPVEPTHDLIESLCDLGEIRFIVAPNNMHHRWASAWVACFPDAELFVAPGLDAAGKVTTPTRRVLGAMPPDAWGEIFDQVLIEGTVLSEVEFFHRPSRTIIVTDLIENLELGRVRRVFDRMLVRIGGAADPDGKAPIDMRLSFFSKREALNAAVHRMIAWHPDRIILAHGRWYDHDAQFELRRAFRWVL